MCTDQGGMLYEPRDKDIMKFVIKEAQAADLGEFWIGMYQVVPNMHFPLKLNEARDTLETLGAQDIQ